MKKILTFLVVISSLSLARDLTLDEALLLNEKNNYSLKFAEKEKQKANLNHLITVKNSLPEVKYIGEFKNEGEETNENKNRTQNEHQLKLTQPLFPSTTILGGINFSDINKKLKELEFIAAKRDEALNIKKLFITVLKKQNEMKALLSSLNELDVMYEKQKKMLEHRLITKVDLLKIEHSILEIKSAILACENNIHSIGNDLKLKLAIPKSEDLILATMEIPEKITHKLNFKEDLIHATTKSVDALIAELSKQQKEIAKSLSKADLLPKVEAFGALKNDSEKNSEWEGGVNINWNIFNFGKGLDVAKLSLIDYEKENISQNIITDKINLEMLTLFSKLVELESELLSKTKALDTAKENYKIDKKRFEQRLISTVDFLSSETQIREANINLNNLLLDYFYSIELYKSKLV